MDMYKNLSTDSDYRTQFYLQMASNGIIDVWEIEALAKYYSNLSEDQNANMYYKVLKYFESTCN